MNRKLMEKGVRLVLEGMGVDLKDSNFLETPQRVARMYEEMLTPSKNSFTQFPSPTKGMIILRGHKVFALCPHHLQVVELKAYVGYIPKKNVLGLSKLARVVEEHLTKPIMQEELGDLVADTLYDRLSCDGVGVVLAGSHGCMRHRGILTQGDVVTRSLRGLFLHSPQTRAEFDSSIGVP